MSRITVLVVCTLALALCAGYAVAETTPGPDTLKVDYFANANTAGAPDGTVRLTNPGTNGGSLCANIYVFDAEEELSECCSCILSPDDLRTLSVNSNLTANPLTGVTLNTGVVKYVSTPPPTSGVCPTYPTELNPVAGIRGWSTHIQNSNFTITETVDQDATLSAAEVSRLDVQCYAIQIDGSGKGQCSCGSN